MTTVRCPRCHDEVTLPARAGKRTHVRCPMCLEDYLLEEALRNAPPMLEVIGGELEPALVGAPASPGYASMNDMDAGFTPAGAGDDGGLTLAPHPASDVFGTVGPTAGEAAVAPAGGVRAAPRPRRKQRSALGTIVGVVFGGALGVGLAPLAIWWILAIFRPNADDLDPLGLAPKLPESLRFVLPAKLREQVERPLVAQGAGGNMRSNPPVNNGNVPQPMPTPMPDPNEFAGNPGNPDPVKPDPLTPAVDSLPATTPDENPEPLVVKPATNTTDAPPPGNVRQVTEVLAAVTAADGAADNYAAADPADKDARKKLAIELYEAACQIGPLVKGMNWENADVASVKERVESFVGSQSDKVSMVGTLAVRRLNDPDAPPGILLAGKVTDLAAAGKQFAVTLAVGKMMQEVVVITSQNPQDICNVDDTLLVLGAIERDPSKVKGYDGPAELLVVSGHLQKVE